MERGGGETRHGRLILAEVRGITSSAHPVMQRTGLPKLLFPSLAILAGKSSIVDTLCSTPVEVLCHTLPLFPRPSPFSEGLADT